MKKTIFVSGNFNIIHPGHLRILKFAKNLGEKLVVGVQSDELGGDAIQIPQELRLENVRSNKLVDEVILIDNNVSKIIKKIKPDFVVKGKEYENKENIELDAVNSYGGKLIFSSGELTLSSFELINKTLSKNIQNISLPKDFMERHQINNSQLKKFINNFSEKKTLVIGDLIIDEYIECEGLGMSREDTTLVVTPTNKKKFIGGAGIVAAHAANLGSSVTFFSVVGDDAESKYAKKILDEYNVNSFLFKDEVRPTSLKQRFRSNDKTLLRVSQLHQNNISASMQEKIFKKLITKLDAIDILIFSDFNYGSLPQSLVNKIVKHVKDKNIILAADSQSSSQLGDISRFKDMDFIFPTEYEARVSLRNFDDGLVILSDKLSKKAKAKNLILKLAKDGALLHLSESSKIEQKTDTLNSFNTLPKDVAGAGDSMIVATLLSYSMGANIWQSAFIGSLAAAIQVGKEGNTPMNKEELLSFL